MTTQTKEDEGIQAVRDIRKRISSEFGNDPEKLVEHYLREQERYRDRMLAGVAVPTDTDRDRPGRR
jgi:hypothetical protein